MFYWNVNAANPNNPEAYKSFIYAIDVAKKTAGAGYEFYSSEEFMALYAPVTKVADDMPMTPEYVSNGFSNGSQRKRYVQDAGIHRRRECHQDRDGLEGCHRRGRGSNRQGVCF